MWPLIARFDGKLEQRVSELRLEFRTELQQLRLDLRRLRTDLIR
jgi:hypothetical protein